MAIRRRDKIILGLAASVLFALWISVISVAISYLVSWQRGIDAIQKANSALIAGQWDKTCDLANAALRRHIGNSLRATALYLHGAASSRLNRFADGVRDLNKAIALGSNTGPTYFERGYALVNTARLDEAESDFSKAIIFDPNLGWAYYYRGWIRMTRHKWNKAISDFTEAIRCQPDLLAAICNRAACYEAQLDYDAALADYDSALLLDPQNAKAHAGRGSVLRARGDLNQVLGPPGPASASATFDAALFERDQKVSPPTLPAINLTKAQHWTREHELYVTAQKAEAMGNFEGAIDCYSQALALNLSPQANSVAHMNRGNNYLKMNDEDRALAEYDAAIRDNPRNAGVYVNRGEVLGNRQMHEKAIADYATALRLNPNQAEAYYNRALEYLKTKNIDAAIHDLDTAIKLKPDLCESYLRRAAAFARKGEIARQRADLQTAAKSRQIVRQLL